MHDLSGSRLAVVSFSLLEIQKDRTWIRMLRFMRCASGLSWTRLGSAGLSPAIQMPYSPSNVA